MSVACIYLDISIVYGEKKMQRCITRLRRILPEFLQSRKSVPTARVGHVYGKHFYGKACAKTWPLSTELSTDEPILRERIIYTNNCYFSLDYVFKMKYRLSTFFLISALPYPPNVCLKYYLGWVMSLYTILGSGKISAVSFIIAMVCDFDLTADQGFAFCMDKTLYL